VSSGALNSTHSRLGDVKWSRVHLWTVHCIYQWTSNSSEALGMKLAADDA